MNYKFKYTGRIVSFFVFVALLVLIVSIALIAVNRKIFVKKFTFKTLFNDAVGLSVKTPIIFKGFEIGEIKSFNLNDDNLIDAEFIIFEAYRKKIVQNSVLRKTINPITNKSSIELIQGSEQTIVNEEYALVPEISTYKGKEYLTKSNITVSADMVSSIISNINQFIANLNEDNNQDQGSVFRILYHVANTSESLEQLLIKTNETVAKLNRDYTENDGELFRFLNQVAEIAKKVEVTADLINETVNSTNLLVKEYTDTDGLVVRLIDPDNEKIIKPINQILSNLNQNMIEINKLLKYFESQSPEISSVIVETQSTLSSAQKTIEGLNNNPLLRGGIEKGRSNASTSGNERPNEIPKE
ncbi:MAG TPA: MlaD family protein [Candidatus Cloacimonadota bacterium]|jgi:ABC-type transporter Mla subunit MlaD|nr:MlaD family protein [Candidatus Cloacimonadales bacterium]HPY97225.1 MlaD family protein [Candidatus Cloacimonadota bacterium]HQB41077.1 MlaD family protein [Candidatus Cloacimonadota bacterium]